MERTHSHEMLDSYVAKKKDVTKWVCLGIIFVCLSFLMISTFQWKYDFSSNILTIRVWQYLLAFFSGGALGLSGLLLQKLTKNNLSDISILGIGSLNIIFIVLFIMFQYDGTTGSLALVRAYLPLISIGSSILGTSIVYTLSKNKPDNCEKFAITGIALQFIFEAISVTLANPRILENQSTQTQVNTEIQNFAYGRFPDIQALSKIGIWRTTTIVSVVVITMLLFVVYKFRKEIDLIELNEELAKFYGVRVKFLKGFLYICVAVIVGIESAMIGSISLLGIVAASFSRLLFKNKSDINIITSFLIGGMLVLLAAFISINLNKNIPIGFLSTSIIAPIFLYLLFKKR
ncbi:iron chelate uptake ABC transporter family permease subunit [Candidatus Mycoplasma haematohominis]|uniref:Putative siderophore transport system permease protein YfhA n=1 Tax=Candidatus Mycoplasma haematohominis TaxID=1494318 RepID=A0A478FPG8_9MOLU|nr:iron chelate uptake ABC transporter family permease subunit [Candidatus Mycoplasma haemohominis]GCE63122.1 putative siderophore transport system permease protein YfhA [Candidatus Mycoplasma haemohominis]